MGVTFRRNFTNPQPVNTAVIQNGQMISLPEEIKIEGQKGSNVQFKVPIRVTQKGYKVSFKPSCGCTVLNKEVTPVPDLHLVDSSIELRVAGQTTKTIYYEIVSPQGDLSNGQIVLSIDARD